MDERICDGCGRRLTDLRYEVRIEIRCAADPLVLSEEDLAAGAGDDLARLVRVLEHLSEEEAMDQVYRSFAFDLCPACQARYLRAPLGGLPGRA